MIGINSHRHCSPRSKTHEVNHVSQTPLGFACSARAAASAQSPFQASPSYRSSPTRIGSAQHAGPNTRVPTRPPAPQPRNPPRVDGGAARAERAAAPAAGARIERRVGAGRRACMNEQKSASVDTAIKGCDAVIARR
jgi:hypothetical protein